MAAGPEAELSEAGFSASAHAEVANIGSGAVVLRVHGAATKAVNFGSESNQPIRHETDHGNSHI